DELLTSLIAEVVPVDCLPQSAGARSTDPKVLPLGLPTESYLVRNWLYVRLFLVMSENRSLPTQRFSTERPA
ncbi:MAG: hypothetical protein WA717_01555, partial [Methyloceanibacter sp.]